MLHKTGLHSGSTRLNYEWRSIARGRTRVLVIWVSPGLCGSRKNVYEKKNDYWYPTFTAFHPFRTIYSLGFNSCTPPPKYKNSVLWNRDVCEMYKRWWVNKIFQCKHGKADVRCETTSCINVHNCKKDCNVFTGLKGIVKEFI